MNPFIKDFKKLILMTSTCSAGDDTLASKDDVLRRLKDFDELYRDYSGVEDLSNLKLRLLGNLTFVIATLQKTDEKLVVLNSMKNLLQKTVVDDIQFFIHLYNTAFYQIYKEQKEKLSEEFKLVVLEFSIELIKRSTKRLLHILYNIEYGAKFSMGVLITVQIAEEEKSIKLRTSALDFLLHSMQYHRKNDKIIQSLVGDLFMLYLPGVIGRIEDIILREETQPHIITVKAITCWGQLLCTVMQDIQEESKLTDDEQVKVWMNLGKEENDEAKALHVKEALQEKKRSKNWLEAAAQTLKPLIKKITGARKHSHMKVRLELTIQISCILDNCLMTLKNAINPMLDVLISSTEDEENNVRDAAELAISRFEARCRSGSGQVYLNFIEENLNSLLNKLPNIIHLKDDRDILNAMLTFSGDLKILSNSRRLECVINCSSTLVRLVRVLVIASTLELYPEMSAQEYSIWEEEPTNWRKEWKRFKYFIDEKIARKLSEACKLLGSSSTAETILDYLFGRLIEEQSCQNEILYIINEVVSGCNYLEDNIVRHFLDVYLRPEFLYLVLQVDDENCLNVHQLHANIITVALVMEGMGKLSRVIGNRFQEYLLKSLYYVMEKMGSSYTIIRTSAMTAAVEIASAVGLKGDIRSLIQTNVDYLTYHITVKLRRNHSGVFDVVTVLMKNSPFEAINNLEEIINKVVKSSSEKFESPQTISYLRLFQTFVQCVNRWLIERKTSKGEEHNPEVKTEVDLLIEYIAEQEKPKDDIGEEVEDVKETTGEAMATEKEEKFPKHVELVVSIAENALNHLPSNDFDRKLIVLEILNESILILADWENQLLPLVHKIWSPLVTRFDRMADPLLINRSFELLYNLSKTSKDFIRRRTLKNVLPTLRDFLSKSAEKSKLKDSGTGYQYTQVFKLQRQLLSKLAVIAIHLRLSGKELDSIVECALPYLSNVQPQPLQDMCRKFFSDLKDDDPYLIWYKLNPLRSEPESSGNAGKILECLIPAESTHR